MSEERHFRDAPPAEVLPLLDHLVGEDENVGRNTDPLRSGCLQIDAEQVLGRRLYRKIARPRSVEDEASIAAGLPVNVVDIDLIADEAPLLDESLIEIDGRHVFPGDSIDHRT